MDYADQRYYVSYAGRFNVPDPVGLRGARLAAPGSWNRYAYAEADPNFIDVNGLCTALAGTSVCISETGTGTAPAPPPLGLPPAAGGGGGSGRFGNAELDGPSQNGDDGTGGGDGGGDGDTLLNVWNLPGFSAAYSLSLGALALGDCARHFGLAGSSSMNASEVLIHEVNATPTATNVHFSQTTDSRAGASAGSLGTVVRTSDPWAYPWSDGNRYESTRAVININLTSWNRASTT